MTAQRDSNLSGAMQRTAILEKRLVTLLGRTVPFGELAARPFAEVRRALVLAPHFDDEIISCGGAIRQHRLLGHEVGVLYFSDGSAAAGTELEPAALTAARMAESVRSGAILGVTDQEYLHQPDGHLCVNDALVSLLVSRLQDCDLVYAPHESDAHPDHQAVFRTLQGALARLRRPPRVAYYEFWKPICPNYYLDISDAMETKVRALREHETQLRFVDYIRLMTTLGRYRGQRLGVSYAEAYLVQQPRLTEEVL